MGSPRGARLAAVGAACGLALVVASCTTILGVDSEFDDATLAMCQCQDFLSVLGAGSASECRSTLDDLLKAAPAAQQASWIAAYDAHRCESCTTPLVDRLRCLFDRPICAELGSACDQPAACCDYLSFDSATPKSACLPDPNGGDGRTCQACVAEGGS